MTLHCSCCGRPAKDLRHGWATSCYQRWLKAGRPAGGPPPPKSTQTPAQAENLIYGRLVAAERYERRLAEFRRLDSIRRPLNSQWTVPGQRTDKQIAAIIGVDSRTIARYRATERAAGRGWWKDGRPRPMPQQAQGQSA